MAGIAIGVYHPPSDIWPSNKLNHRVHYRKKLAVVKALIHPLNVALHALQTWTSLT